MTDIPFSTALIVGAGPGVSASLARALSAAGLKVGLAARDIEKLAPLAAETGAKTFEVDAADPAGVAELFADVDERLGVPTWWSTTPRRGSAAGSPRSIRNKCAAPSRSRRSGVSWSPSRRRSA